MASVNIDVHARLVDRDLRKATYDVKRSFENMGRDAGNSFSNEWARGAEKGSDKVVAAMDRSAIATEKVQKAEERLTAAYRSKDYETIITATTKLAKARQEASTQTDRFHKSMQALNATLPGMANSLQNAENSASGLTNAVSGLTGALGKVGTPIGLVGVGSALVEVAAVAARASQALWLLPAAISAAGAGIGTLVLGMQGFGDALSSIRDPEKVATALQTLAPSAQQAALSLRAILPAWDEVQAATSQALFAGVGPALNQLATTYLPMIQQMTTGIAGSFNQMFQGITAQLMTPETQGAIQTLMQNITATFQQLGPIAAPLVKAFAEIASVGSAALPGIAKAATDLAIQFSAFIEKASQSGDLGKWLNEGLSTLSDLGDMAIELGKAFITLAPYGAKLLPDIVNLLKELQPLMPAIGVAALAMGPSFGVWAVAIESVNTAFDVIKAGANNILIPTMNMITQQINNAVQLIRGFIALLNKLPGVNITVPDIPEIPKIPQIGSTAPTGTPHAEPSSLGGEPNAGRERRGYAPIPDVASTVPTYPTQGYDVPVPTPKDTTGSGSADNGPVAPYTGTPQDLLKGFQIDSQLYSAAGAVLDARQRRAQAELDLNELLKDNESTASEIAKARNDLARADREALESEIKLNEAKANSTKQTTDQMRKDTKALNDGLGLDPDLGLSKGLPGLVENLFRAMFSGILAPLNQAAGPDPSGGLLGMLQERNRANGVSPILGRPVPPGYYDDSSTDTSSSSSSSYSGSSYSGSGNANVNAMLALAQNSSGKTAYGPASDLVHGLADCSGSISDLYEVLTKGVSTPARMFTTTNFASDAEAAKLGFLPGYQPGALNVGVNPYPGQRGHMAATLPNGVNFEGGGGTGGGAQYGGSAAGARDPQFERQYYLPIGSGMPTTAPDIGSGTPGNLASGPSGFPIPLPVTIVGGSAPALGAPPGIPTTPIPGAAPGSTPTYPSSAPTYPGSAPSTPAGVPGLYSPENTSPGLNNPAAPGMPYPGTPGPGGPVPAGPGGPAVAPASYTTPYTDRAQGDGGWQSNGEGGIKAAGLLTAAISGAAGAAGSSIAPGAGAATQLAMELANRTAQYGSQVAGIATSGLMETFLPASSELGDPSKSWFGRIISGLAGAKPATDGSAGQGENKKPLDREGQQALAEKGGQAAQAKGPATVHIDTVNQQPNTNAAQMAQEVAFRTNAQGMR